MEDSLDAFAEGAGGTISLHSAAPAPLDERIGSLQTKACNLLGAWAAATTPQVEVGGRPMPVGTISRLAAVEIAVHGWDVGRTTGAGAPCPRSSPRRSCRRRWHSRSSSTASSGRRCPCPPTPAPSGGCSPCWAAPCRRARTTVHIGHARDATRAPARPHARSLTRNRSTGDEERGCSRQAARRHRGRRVAAMPRTTRAGTRGRSRQLRRPRGQITAHLVRAVSSTRRLTGSTTMLQMVGVLVLALGLPPMFKSLTRATARQRRDGGRATS